MSIPRLNLVEDGAPFETELIARLANELFAESSTTSAPVSAPVAVAGLPGHIPASAPGTPAAASTPSAPVNPENALAGGFPSSNAPDAPPPVHPTVVAPEPESKDGNAAKEISYTGNGTRKGPENSYLFGDPKLYARTADTPGTGSGPSRIAPGHSPNARQDPETVDGRSTGSSSDESQFYFLSHLSEVASPTHVQAPIREASPGPSGFDVEGVRRDFPALQQRVNGHPLIWLDNAATTQKPQSVLDATSHFYGCDNSNIHRAAHVLAERSTQAFEAGREKVRQFLGAADAKEIIFVRGTTEGINLIAQSYGRQHVGAGDEILLTTLEHHANIVPWQMLAQQTGANIRVIPINDRGELILEAIPALLNERTKIVSLTQVSNSLGTLNPVGEIISMAHSRGIPVVVDGAQSTPHLPVNVQALDADFFVFSGHKVFSPTGIGAVYGKSHLLEAMPPWQGGGHMIKDVTFERTIYNHAPEKFEAGTPDIAGVVGLGAAIDYMTALGIPGLAAYEHNLLEYATEALKSVRGIRPIGTAHNKASVLGFVIPGFENTKIAKHLDHRGIAVRAGHHCALPSLRHFGVESTVRPSLAFYNTFAEVDTLVESLWELTR